MSFRRKSLLNCAVLRRFAVTLCDNEGTFSGVLTACDDTTLVLEQCLTDKNQPIAGRVFVDRIQIAYMQQLEVGT